MQKRKITFLIAIIILTTDLLTKYLLKNKTIIIIKDFLRLDYIKNYGAAWSIMQNQRIALIVISIVFFIIILKYMFDFKSNLRNNIAFGLLIGGLLGNLIDRVFLGYVRDFISFRFGSYYFPAFNLADSAIVIGVILLIIAMIKKEDNNAKDKS